MIPPAFTRNLFRQHARPRPAVVDGVAIELEPFERDGQLGFRECRKVKIVVAGCLLDATITTSITIDGSKGMK